MSHVKQAVKSFPSCATPISLRELPDEAQVAFKVRGDLSFEDRGECSFFADVEPPCNGIRYTAKFFGVGPFYTWMPAENRWVTGLQEAKGIDSTCNLRLSVSAAPRRAP